MREISDIWSREPWSDVVKIIVLEEAYFREYVPQSNDSWEEVVRIEITFYKRDTTGKKMVRSRVYNMAGYSCNAWNIFHRNSVRIANGTRIFVFLWEGL